jgi:hypothetical protein
MPDQLSSYKPLCSANLLFFSSTGSQLVFTSVDQSGWSIAFRKPREYLRALKHVDIIMETYHVKERVSNL